MSAQFADTLRRLRTESGLSQRELARRMYVTHSTAARWENGSRLPDAVMTSRLARCLGVDIGVLRSAEAEGDEAPNVIMVDDREIALTEGLPILEEAMPDATIVGFTRPSEALEYARSNQVALAFLEIELRSASGLDLCRELLEINPRTNVVFLTAYAGYSLDAWRTGASGFMLRPITPEGIREQLERLRYPFSTDANKRVSRSFFAQRDVGSKASPVRAVAKEKLDASVEGDLEEEKGIRLSLDDLEKAAGGWSNSHNMFYR